MYFFFVSPFPLFWTKFDSPIILAFLALSNSLNSDPSNVLSGMLKYFCMLQKITAWMIIQPSIGNGVMTPAVVNDGTPFHFSFVVML